MTRPTILLAALAAVALAVGLFLRSDGASQPPAAQADDGGARVLLRNVAGNPVGVAKLTEDDDEVLVRVTVHDLPAGFHGFHIHANNDPSNGSGCVAPAFTSADGHLNPAAQGHPGHAGDMPVLLVNADGTGEARFKTDRVSVAGVIGGALIIHASPDNYANIPVRYLAPPATITAVDAATLGTGDAAGRIACGVIEG